MKKDEGLEIRGPKSVIAPTAMKTRQGEDIHLNADVQEVEKTRIDVRTGNGIMISAA